jgi:hypothetical protein
VGLFSRKICVFLTWHQVALLECLVDAAEAKNKYFFKHISIIVRSDSFSGVLHEIVQLIRIQIFKYLM